MLKKEQKTFIKKKPLTDIIEDQKGVKIQARSDLVYNPAERPTRQEVREINYDRRHEQLTQQGFHAYPEKPYKPIGPLYLDNKELILTALGQWDLDEHDSGVEDTQKEEGHSDPKAKAREAVTPANFVLRRTRKDLNTLNKEIHHGRNLIRNIRLGHGLFQTLKKEAQHKMSAAERESQRKHEEMLNNWLPAKVDDSSSDDDETDEDLSREDDLNNYGVSSVVTDVDDVSMVMTGNIPSPIPIPTLTETLPPTDSPDLTKSRVSFAVDPSTYREGPTDHSVSSAITLRGKKARKMKDYLQSRPYTPVDNNIQGLLKDDPETTSLFRQLCALNWLMEAMNFPGDVSIQICPISASWTKHSDKIGGYKLKPSKIDLRKTTETSWDSWVSNKPLKVSRRYMTKKTTTPRRISLYSGSRMRESPSNSSLTGSNSQLNSASGSTSVQGTGQGSVRVDLTIHEENQDENEEMNNKSKVSLFSFLDEYYASLRKEEDGDTEPDVGKKQEIGHWEWDIFAFTKDKKKDKKETDGGDSSGRRSNKKGLDLTKSLDSKPKDDHQAYILERKEKLEIRQLRTSYHLIRPQSSPAMLEYQARLPSHKKQHITAQLRQHFSQVSENSALTMHDRLEKIERQRMKKCEKKFGYIATRKKHGINFHEAVSHMRSHSIMEEDNKDQNKPTHSKWLVDLENMVASLPQKTKESWYFKNIMGKLKKFGKAENTQSVYQFLTVLEKLKVWEICNPDVSSAIDFCRQKVVEMPVDDYDDWFMQNFPSVSSAGSKVRPQTAPPGVNHKPTQVRIDTGKTR